MCPSCYQTSPLSHALVLLLSARNPTRYHGSCSCLWKYDVVDYMTELEASTDLRVFKLPLSYETKLVGCISLTWREPRTLSVQDKYIFFFR